MTGARGGEGDGGEREAGAHASASDFERLPAHAALDTTRLFLREELWEAPDPERAASEGDFFGRLTTLFGAPDRDGGFVLRHRATGIVVTATAAPGPPSYGGRARSSAGGENAQWKEMQRLKDEWNAVGVQLLTTIGTGELPSLQLLVQRKEAWRRLAELSAPEGYGAVVEALEDLVQRAELTDYERVLERGPADDAGGASGAIRVGVRGGVPFVERA